MKAESCIICDKKTLSVISTEAGYVCYNCYVQQEKLIYKKDRHNIEAQIQSEFFEKIKIFFPKLPDKLLFAVPNGGSRHKMEAANLKRQGVISGVADVILLIPKNGFASLCLEFKTSTGLQSKEQCEFQRQAELCGSKYVIVRSAADAIDSVRRYLIE